jgi:hypothetical protein
VMGGSSWPTFQHRFQPFYDWAAPTGKRLMVWVGLPENSSDPYWKANYFSGMQNTIETSMPRVRAVVYFHAQTSAGVFFADTTQTSWDAYAKMASDPYFGKTPKV